MPLTFKHGDATRPESAGHKIIAHICNDAGGWGAGFVLAISKRWPQAEADYRAWYRDRAANDFALGAIRLVRVSEDVSVANMIGQHGIRRAGSVPPIRYEAVEQCLRALAEQALPVHASVHMPRIGCGLAGGSWERIEPLVRRALVDPGIYVTVYDFP